MTKENFIEVIKANSIVRKNGDTQEFVFGENDIELLAQELDHKINTLNM